MTVGNPANGNLVAGAATVFFPQRYASVEIVNNDTQPMYARTDGIAPDGGSPAPGDYEILPGNRAVIPNSAPFWWQGFNSAASNPGTTVKLSSASAASTAAYEVIGR